MPKKSRVSYEQLLEINRLADEGMSQKAIASTLGVSRSVVSRELGQDWTVEELVAEAGAGGLMSHERDALDRLLAEMNAGPGFERRWSPLDVQTIAIALRRLAGHDERRSC